MHTGDGKARFSGGSLAVAGSQTRRKGRFPAKSDRCPSGPPRCILGPPYRVGGNRAGGRYPRSLAHRIDTDYLAAETLTSATTGK
jgi:hypothetical protein